MSARYNLVQDAKIVPLLKPAADAAGRSSAYFSVKNAHKVFIVVHIDQGNAATIALTPSQATAVAGTGVKVLANAVRIWANLDVAANADALTRATDAVNYTTDAGVKEKMVVFEIDPAELDTANGFDCLKIATGASDAANITQAYAILAPLRYAQATPPSALAN